MFGTLVQVAQNSGGRALLQITKHSPQILFGVGVVGVVGTAVVASKATLKVEGILDEAQTDIEKCKIAREEKKEQYSEQDFQKDIAVVYTRTTIRIVKNYAPAIGLGFLTIACFTGSHRILLKRNAGLMAAYAVLDKGFKEYRGRIYDRYGAEADLYGRYGVEKEVIVRGDGQPSTALMHIPESAGYSGYARFFDESLTSWQPTPEYNLFFLNRQQNWANDKLRARGHVFLNEVYDSLGMDRSSAGSVVGWVLGNGDDQIDFGLYDPNNERIRAFVNGHESAILLDFNVDGVIYDKI